MPATAVDQRDWPWPIDFYQQGRSVAAMGLGEGHSRQDASLGNRAIAAGVDGLVQVLLIVPVAVSITTVVVATADPATRQTGSTAVVAGLVALVVTPFVVVGYHVGMEGRYAETIGKRLFDLRVVDGRGAPVHWRGAVLRNVFRLIDVLPFGYVLGSLVIWFDGDNRRLGDYVARTRVVRRGQE
jgi:uncharacterized RDD family membrane protein YckC